VIVDVFLEKNLKTGNGKHMSLVEIINQQYQKKLNVFAKKVDVFVK
jgi:hypothetical protein